MIQERRLTPRRGRAWYYLTSCWTLFLGMRPLTLLLRLAVGHTPDAAVVRIPGQGLAFPVRNVMDVWILKEVCLDREYETAGESIQDGWTIVDVGAGIGAFAIDVAARHPGAIVHAFEPSPESFSRLRQGLALNHIRNVRPFEWAVGSGSGPAWLDVSGPEPFTHRLADTRSDTTVEVTQRTLDDVFRQLEISTCDFLKMDCEGSEFAILRSASAGCLKKVRRVCLEYHDGPGRSHQELVDILQDAGFAVTVTPGRAYRETGFLYARRASS